jgi:chromate transport protein ChrA
MAKNSNSRASMQKMIDGIKVAVFLSLATDIYEVYGFVNEPGGFRKGISIALGILVTVLIWQFGRSLRAEKKRALFYWLIAVAVGMVRWIFIDATFSLTVLSILLLALFVTLTLRIAVWTRNGLLT